jgi:hypothetical protein
MRKETEHQWNDEELKILDEAESIVDRAFDEACAKLAPLRPKLGVPSQGFFCHYCTCPDFHGFGVTCSRQGCGHAKSKHAFY